MVCGSPSSLSLLFLCLGPFVFRGEGAKRLGEAVANLGFVREIVLYTSGGIAQRPSDPVVHPHRKISCGTDLGLWDVEVMMPGLGN